MTVRSSFLIATPEFLSYTVWGNTVADYIWFAVLLLAAAFLAKLLTRWIVRAGSRITTALSDAQHAELFASLITNPLWRLMQTVLLYAAVNRLNRPFDLVLISRGVRKQAVQIRLIDILDHIFILCALIFITLLVSRLIDFIFRVRYEIARQERRDDRIQLLPLLKDVVKLLVWATGIFAILGVVFHVNVPALITGLGIGGIAIALAGKETVENLFASFTILIDRPFKVDDVIKLGNFEGRVLKVGFRSTRLRSPEGTVYVIPNKKLVDDNLENQSRRNARRIRFSIMIKYGLGEQELSRIMEDIRELLKNDNRIKPLAEINIETLAENAVQLLVTYQLPHPMSAEAIARVKQDISLGIFRIAQPYIPATPVTTLTPPPPPES